MCIRDRKIIMNNKKHEEQTSQYRAEVSRELNEVGGQLTLVKEDMRMRLAQLGATPMQRGNTVEHLKSVSFNGEGEYLMEFIKELEEIRKEYYMNEGVYWMARHLEGEAAIWWKLVRNEIDTFQKFQEAFIAKYWNQMIQEDVRDRLEFVNTDMKVV